MEDARTLQTRAMKEKERRQKALEMPPVRLRVVLPDRWCLQCIFTATEPVCAVYTLVAGLLAHRPDAFELFTTPPKCVLRRDSRDTLYDSGLVPSAKLHLSLRGGKQAEAGQILKPGVLDKYSVHSADQVAGHGKVQASAAGREKEASQSGAMAKEASNSGAQAAAQASTGNSKGLPKWLKLGKK